MEEILIALLKKDAKLLTRRNEFIDVLDAEVPPKYRRQYMAVRQALELNVGEIFSLKNNDFNAAKSDVEKILKDSGMQEVHINAVLEIFEKILANLPQKIDDEENFEPTETFSTNKKVDFDKNNNKINKINSVSPSSVSDVAYLSYLMRMDYDLDDYDEFLEIHPSTDSNYKIIKTMWL